MSVHDVGSSLTDIIGTPYRFPSHPPETFDCWSLVTYARKCMGLETKLIIDPKHFTPDTVLEAVQHEQSHGNWKPVRGEPQVADVVLFGMNHISLFTGNGVLHAYAPAKSVIFTRMDVLERRHPNFEVWRP